MIDYEPLLEKLEDIIIEANIAYHDNDEPIMTDEQYDDLCKAHKLISSVAGLKIYDSFGLLR